VTLAALTLRLCCREHSAASKLNGCHAVESNGEKESCWALPSSLLALDILVLLCVGGTVGLRV
jgi:hypothetical protein